ncbi:MAG: hypothetical protein AAGD96_19545, partial [Chloroflexota bacterium]
MKLNFNTILRVGALTGLAIFYVSMVGMVETFNEREIIRDLWEVGNIELLSLGQVLMVLPSMIGGYFISRRIAQQDGSVSGIVSGVLVGLISAIPMVILIIAGTTFPNIRNMFVSVNPSLMEALTWGFSREDAALTGALILATLMIFAALDGAVVATLPDMWRKSIINAAGWVLGIGVMSELLNQIFSTFRDYGWLSRDTVRLMIQSGTIKPGFAGVILIIAFLWPIVMPYIRTPLKERYEASTPTAKTTTNYIGYALLLLLLIALPWLVGRFLSDVLVTISLYVLMGLGLNIAVGMAGLLDLGYLTNFAVGAYVTGILVSTGPQGIAANGGPAFFNLWWLIPIALLSAMLTGFVFALPVLRMRGDYLAIATLGFGEIIAKLALSDALKP